MISRMLYQNVDIELTVVAFQQLKEKAVNRSVFTFIFTTLILAYNINIVKIQVKTVNYCNKSSTTLSTTTVNIL